MIEDFGIPVPGETVLIAAAVYAGAGRLNVLVVGVIGFVAAVIGDNIGFAIGHYGGRTLVLRWGRYMRLTGERLHKAEISLGGKFGGGDGVAAPAGQDGLDEVRTGRPQRPPGFGQQPRGFLGGWLGQARLAEQQRLPPLVEQHVAEHSQPAAGPQPGRCRGEKPQRLLAGSHGPGGVAQVVVLMGSTRAGLVPG
jgi:hypothetical protein